MIDEMDTHHGLPRPIKREDIYTDVLETYQDNLCDILQEYPFRIRFENERAFDTGGVCRDMYSFFWDKVYLEHFDGERLLVPSGMDTSKYKLLGTILAHGFMVCGFLPVKIAFPVIAAVLLGPENLNVSDTILLESFVDFISAHEGTMLREAVVAKSLTPSMTSSLIDTLSRYDCKEIPTSQSLLRLVTGIAKQHFLGKTFGMLFMMHLGVPHPYHPFWKKYTVNELFELYKALNATTGAVLKRLIQPEAMNSAEARIYSYLQTYVRNMKCDELRLFIRFVTGSSVMVAQDIRIYFNFLSGLSRRPISHTCDCGLELSVVYSSFPEFENEFSAVLSSEFSWIMDSV